MTGKNARQEAFLRLVSDSSTVPKPEIRYLLSSNQDVVIGRDPTCQILLDSQVYGVVSRRHAVVRPLPPSADGESAWVICDLNSANGTYLNDEPLQGCQQLQAGDRIILGSDGAEFVFEYADNHQPAPVQLGIPVAIPTTAHAAPGTKPDGVSMSQLFPLLSTGKDLTSKAYLLPGIITVVFVVLMFATVGKPEAVGFNQKLVAIYLAGAAYYFVYQLCGKHKPWWELLACAAATVLLLRSPILDGFLLVFRTWLPGAVPLQADSVSFPELLLRMFFGAGLMEELLKAVPLAGAFLIGRLLPSPWRERIGIWEPLDGILLGTAAAVGFTLVETLSQYVPDFVRTISNETGAGASQFVGLQLLIPRILGSVSGHMAYSGYLGYFIGLSVLKPREGWQILTVGILTASGLHALWNATGVYSALWLALVGVLSYACLTAAILKARALSPTRAHNFATRLN
ncbi:MAG: PrsW family glutamic-type intramembrane protease [Nostocaceae cyanobacterium]|nr:PrsW family glutamic-type intramembrane protease [Nostocaceae cyanobacterium]